MKSKIFGLKASLVVALATAVFLPQMSVAGTLSDKDAEIQNLKAQLKACHMHKKAKKKKRISFRRSRSRRNVVASRTQVIERPVYLDRVVTKEVFVDRPVMVERNLESQAVIEPVAVAADERVIVQHTKKKRKPLIHIGIPFIGVGLF